MSGVSEKPWGVRRRSRMAIQKQLQEVERTVGFKYPMSFISMFEDFASLLSTETFRRAFPDARLLLSAPEIAAARESTSAAFLPFMREEHPRWPDIYAFDLDHDGPEFRVIVWSDHAIVMDWESFPVFFQWVREHIATHDPAG
jgi:hypothetical protein